MNCAECMERLLEGPSEKDLPEACLEHLEGCPECRQLLDLWRGLDAPSGPEGLEEGVASGRMRRRFLEAAEPELRRLRAPGPGGRAGERRSAWTWALPMAASLLLSLGAFLYGLRMAPRGRLEGASANQRLETVALLGQGLAQEPGGLAPEELTRLLLDRVRRDPNVQVRLASVEALYLRAGEAGLEARLEEALHAPQDPQVQLALVDLMGALRRQRAAEALRRLQRDGRLDPAARARAAERLAQIPLRPL